MSTFSNSGFIFEGDSTFNQVGGNLHKGDVIHRHSGAADVNSYTTESNSTIGSRNASTPGTRAGSNNNSHQINGGEVNQHHQHNGLDEHPRSYTGDAGSRRSDDTPSISSEQESPSQEMHEQSRRRCGAPKTLQQAAPDPRHPRAYNTPPASPTQMNHNSNQSSIPKSYAATAKQPHKSGGGSTGKSNHRTAD
ncbi:hypothetical protein BD779DRAFT_259129 [Infundibulicybe gibba]|nr:hypothetical protein BD779DRAFT_259129 [Infundibulicybe gibba]